MIKHSFQERGQPEGGLRCGEDDMVPGQEGVEGTGVNETIKKGVNRAKLRRTKGCQPQRG